MDGGAVRGYSLAREAPTTSPCSLGALHAGTEALRQLYAEAALFVWEDGPLLTATSTRRPPTFLLGTTGSSSSGTSVEAGAHARAARGARDRAIAARARAAPMQPRATSAAPAPACRWMHARMRRRARSAQTAAVAPAKQGSKRRRPRPQGERRSMRRGLSHRRLFSTSTADALISRGGVTGKEGGRPSPFLFVWEDMPPLLTAMRNVSIASLSTRYPSRTMPRARAPQLGARPQPHDRAAREGRELEEVVAAPGFRLLATMNPGGDFGKKGLSPALRNRFTEIWVPAVGSRRAAASCCCARGSRRRPPRPSRTAPPDGTWAARCWTLSDWLGARGTARDAHGRRRGRRRGFGGGRRACAT